MGDAQARPESEGTLTIISGPAGSGKTTLCERLIAEFPEVVRVVTTTSRAPRSGEVPGRDYHFLSVAEFEQRIAEGAFYEWAKVHGRYYGSERRYVLEGLAGGRDLLLNIDVQGAESYRRAASEDPYLEKRLTTVFVELADPAQIRQRLLERGADDEDEIRRRLGTALRELEEAPKFHHRIVSRSRDEDYAAFRTIFQEHRRSVRTGFTG